MAANYKIDLNEKYTIQVGSEVYSMSYPTLDESTSLAKRFEGLKEEDSVEMMKTIMKEKGLNEKFFELKGIRGQHIINIWKELNAINL